MAAPAFKGIVEKALPYLNVFPRGTLIVKNESDYIPKRVVQENKPLIEEVKMGKGMEREVMPDLVGLSMRSAMSQMEGKGLIIRISGNGKLVDQVPKPGTMIEKGDICYLKFQSS